MKKYLILIILVLIGLSFNFSKVSASELQLNNNDSFDDSLNSVIEGIDENSFSVITDLINNFFGEDKSFKERVLLFITGENTFDLNLILSYFKSSLSGVLNVVIEIVSYVLFISIILSCGNIIISKNNGNNENNIIYYICYTVIITLCSKIISIVFSIATDTLNDINKNLEIAFPILLTLSEFSGGFGLSLSKPFFAFSSLLSSSLINNFFVPLLSVCSAIIIVGNLSSTIKLNSLKKSIFSLLKWIIGIITLAFTFFLTASSIVNMQYGGISFKILKYATGSMIPIVGGFISGGLDVLLSSSILVKNSVGLILVIYIILNVFSVGITIIILSFVTKFLISVCEPIIDEKIVNLFNGIAEVFSYLSAIVFTSGFSYVLVCFSLISSTSLIF